MSDASVSVGGIGVAAVCIAAAATSLVTYGLWLQHSAGGAPSAEHVTGDQLGNSLKTLKGRGAVRLLPAVNLADGVCAPARPTKDGGLRHLFIHYALL